ncbi:HlyD family efflux transporter periplasmic adaptor subunit [Microbulbifer hydrolyticus]|uniref:HlyD family efflux transporter periplasmic adaptor subunit n=1 Tax=Microbulbifer hydrolyticus TaxID=48074 RepID=A0ABX6J4X4_9GAMM|nr:HlyD family efflux transporter periplasmic adaptor subunit [Microbulbifer hydrolyticus]
MIAASLIFVLFTVAGILISERVQTSEIAAEEGADVAEVGAHNGRVLRDGDFAVELAIFERGVPPEYRVWVTNKGKPLDPQLVDITVQLTRLGGKKERVGFEPDQDFLRGNTVIREPHSFVVMLEARYQGKKYQWEYESFEGRTRIEPEIAESMGITTAVAGPAILRETTKVYGRLVVDPVRIREVRARFDGTVDSVRVELGERVSRGQPIIGINSNENLKTYTINSPIEGVVLERNANPGEQTDGRNLIVIADDGALLAELEVFPATRSRIQRGDTVWLRPRGTEKIVEGVIRQIDPVIRPNQSSTIRVSLQAPAEGLASGMFVAGNIQVAEYQVALAVKRSALQSYRDFTVVYAQVGDQYEVRMLELGREGGEWVEVLGGLEPGTRYVSENSYVIKADIEKSGAAHHH